ncbi:MAG: hypothetical protein WCI17_02735 [bacterium]
MSTDWRAELGSIIDNRAKATRAELESARFVQFLESVAMPAFQELGAELGKHDRKVTVRQTTISATISVSSGDTEEISFRILSRSLPAGIVPYAEVRMRKGQRLVKAEGNLKGTNPAGTIEQVAAGDVITCFLSYFRAAMDSGQA